MLGTKVLLRTNKLQNDCFITNNKTKIIPTLWTTVKLLHHQQISVLLLTVANNLWKIRQQIDHTLNKTVLLHFLGTERTLAFCTNE